jgi:hypothetical protein
LASRKFGALIDAVAREDAKSAVMLARNLPVTLSAFPASRRTMIFSVLNDVVEQDVMLVLTMASALSELMTALSDSGVKAFVSEALERAKRSRGVAERYINRVSVEGDSHFIILQGATPLAPIRGALTLYAVAHCGNDVRIEAGLASSRGFVVKNVIHLPKQINHFGDERDFLSYRVMTARCAGYLEFGTYDVPGGAPMLTKRVEEMQHSEVAATLFQLLEDCRVESHIRAAYPGVARDLDKIAQPIRKLDTSDTAAEQLVCAVEQIVRTGGIVGDDDGAVSTFALEHAESLKSAIACGSIVEEVLTAVIGLVDTPLLVAKTAAVPNSEPLVAAPKPGRLSRLKRALKRGEAADVPEPPPEEAGMAQILSTKAPKPPSKYRELPEAEEPSDGPSAHYLRSMFGDPTGVVAMLPEWDHRVQDHRVNWVRVREHKLGAEAAGFATETLQKYGPLIKGLRKQFEALRPDESRIVTGLTDGESINIDAVVESRIALRCNDLPSERLYQSKRYDRRDVVAAFLLDQSSSTSQQPTGMSSRILDIEKQALICMCEALSAARDPFAVYGYSGFNRDHVAFYTFHDFDEKWGDQGRANVGGAAPLMENRDGAAIRHAVSKLSERPERAKLLFLLSDGRPLDCGCDHYNDTYARQDTRAALIEARRAGIRPIVLTVDPTGSDYLPDMAGVDYIIFDNVSSLPRRLPALYRSLTR